MCGPSISIFVPVGQFRAVIIRLVKLKFRILHLRVCLYDKRTSVISKETIRLMQKFNL
jgi:hypothetical protein